MSSNESSITDPQDNPQDLIVAHPAVEPDIEKHILQRWRHIMKKESQMSQFSALKSTTFISSKDSDLQGVSLRDTPVCERGLREDESGDRLAPWSNSLIRLSRWMRHPCVINKRFWDVTLPGSHNSASWSLAKTKKNRWGGLAYIFLKLYIHCQEKTIFQQLRMGVRFLDIRVCKSLSQGGELYCAHGGFRTIPLKEVLMQIARFCASHSSEVIVLSIRRDVAYLHGPASVSILECDGLISSILNSFLGPELSDNITIRELIDRRQNVLYFFEDRERYFAMNKRARKKNVDGADFLWPGINHTNYERVKMYRPLEGLDEGQIGEYNTVDESTETSIQRENRSPRNNMACDADLFMYLNHLEDRLAHLLEWSEPTQLLHNSMDTVDTYKDFHGGAEHGSCEIKRGVAPIHEIKCSRRRWTFPGDRFIEDSLNFSLFQDSKEVKERNRQCGRRIQRMLSHETSRRHLSGVTHKKPSVLFLCKVLQASRGSLNGSLMAGRNLQSNNNSEMPTKEEGIHLTASERRKRHANGMMKKYLYQALPSLLVTPTHQEDTMSFSEGSHEKNDPSSQKSLTPEDTCTSLRIERRPHENPIPERSFVRRLSRDKALRVVNIAPRKSPLFTSYVNCFLAGHSRIVKSWNLTCDAQPLAVCEKLIHWTRMYGCSCPRKPFILKILAGEVTPPSFGSPEGSADVIRFWTVQGAAALCFRNGGLKFAATETHKHLLDKVLMRPITSRVNGITHDFVHQAVVLEIIKQNFDSFSELDVDSLLNSYRKS